MASRTEGTTEVFKHKHGCVALWKLVVDQVTDQPASACTLCPPICSGIVWDFWRQHFQVTSQEVFPQGACSVYNKDYGNWVVAPSRQEGSWGWTGRHGLVLLAT